MFFCVFLRLPYPQTSFDVFVSHSWGGCSARLKAASLLLHFTIWRALLAGTICGILPWLRISLGMESLLPSHRHEVGSTGDRWVTVYWDSRVFGMVAMVVGLVADVAWNSSVKLFWGE